MKRSCENAEHVGKFRQRHWWCRLAYVNLTMPQVYSPPMPASTIAMSSGVDDLNTTMELGLPLLRNTTMKLRSKICTPPRLIDLSVSAGVWQAQNEGWLSFIPLTTSSETKLFPRI